MKRFIVCLTAFILIICSNNVLAQKTDKKMDGTMPFKAMYSSDFKIGDSKYAKMILDVWKDWDDNQLTRHDYFADTVMGMFANGMVSKGKKAFVDDGMKYRSSMTSVKSSVHAWVPLWSNDRNENAVCIWGTEERVLADGKKETQDIHEVWWFNKDGKVTALRQWVANFAAM